MGDDTQNSALGAKHHRLRAAWQKIYERILKIRGEPREIALGMALGLFVAVSPTMGFQMVIAIFFATLFKWNKIASALGVWLTNPLTAPFIYGLTYLVGSFLIGLPGGNHDVTQTMPLSRIDVMLDKAPHILLALTLGGVIVGLPLAIGGYFFTYTAVSRYRTQIKEKLALQKAKREERRESKHRRKRNKKKSRLKRRRKVPR